MSQILFSCENTTKYTENTKKQVWFASLVWYDIVSSVETSLFWPRIYLVGVLGALEALQCIICHYLRNYGRNHGRTDQAFYYNRLYQQLYPQNPNIDGQSHRFLSNEGNLDKIPLLKG